MQRVADAATYRWLLLFASSLVNGLTWGLLYSVGVLYTVWSQRFVDSSAAFISLVGGLPVSIGCFLGPVFGVILRRFGFRRSGSAGGLIMCVGMVLSSFMQSMLGLLFTFGILTGFGAGLANFSATSTLNDYFIKERALAESVQGAGLCLGMFVCSWIMQVFLNMYGWQGAMLLAGAVTLHISLASLFFLPPDHISSEPLNFWRHRDITLRPRATDVIAMTSSDDEEGAESKLCDDERSSSRSSLKDSEKVSKHDSVHDDLIREEHEEELTIVSFIRRSIQVWRRPIFLLLLTSDFLTWLAIFVPYVHLVERARLQGIDADTAAWLSSACGLAGVVGRPVSGLVCNYFGVHPLRAYCAVQMTVGVATFLSPFWSDVYGLFAFACLFGLLSGGYGFVKASCAVLIGQQFFVVAFSWMLLFEGLGIMLGPFFGGLIHDVTNSYALTFHIAGTMLFLAGAECFLQKLALRWESCSPNTRHVTSTAC